MHFPLVAKQATHTLKEKQPVLLYSKNIPASRHTQYTDFISVPYSFTYSISSFITCPASNAYYAHTQAHTKTQTVWLT